MQSYLVEPVDPVQGAELELVDAPPRAVWANAFGLVERDQALGQGVVVTVRTDRSDGTGLE
jgi:hypothetical protein